MRWRDYGYDHGQHLWEAHTGSGPYQIITTIKQRPQSYTLYGPKSTRPRKWSFGTLAEAKAYADMLQYNRTINPISNTQVGLIATVLVGAAAAVYLLNNA